MRRTAVVLFTVLLACSSGSGKSASSSGAPASSGASSESGAPKSTVDPALIAAGNREGAIAILKLYANQRRELDPTVTQDEVDCIPGAVLDRYTPEQFFAAIGNELGVLSPEDGAKIKDALRSCGFTEQQIERARVS